MKIQSYSEVLPEGLPDLTKDYENDVATLTRSINQVGRNLNQLSTQNVSLTDNVYCSTRELTVKGGVPLALKNTFNTPPKFILVGRVKLNKVTDPALTTAVQILDWSVSGENINVSTIVGLTPGQTYTISFIIFY